MIINMGFYKNASGLAHPTTRGELVKEIKIRLDRGQTNLNDIDTSKVTDMSGLFSNFSRNIDISLWDVSNVRDMSYMFFNCTNFNCDLSKWDVSNVKYMTWMFYNCTNFNSDLSNWDISKVKSMNYMFYGCKQFDNDHLKRFL